MRFESFAVHNYKGIAHAELADLHSEAVVTISGRNGTGKSLLLEALVGVWSGRYSMIDRIGPWSDELVVALRVHLTEDEWKAVDEWFMRFRGVSAPREPLVFEQRSNKSGSNQVTNDSEVMQTLRDVTFQRANPFSVVDFLPANRLVPSAPNPTVDLAMLNVDRVEQERFQMLDQFINQRTPMALPSVANYLVTLDYQSFLAARQGLTVENDYERLATAFVSSTGKKLLLPEYDPARGSNIEIELPAGFRHGLRDLSSGEQEMLAMMYFVRRLSASGGVLCIDEPEQHLHPTLQAALFDAMSDLAERAQVLVVSHSVNLIAAAPLSGLVQVAPPTGLANNQIARMTDHPGKVELVASLGITPADLFQSDMLLVVEGDTDAQWLRALFPVELGRAHVMVAGSSSQVLDAHHTLTEVPAGLPWLCIRDRDLMTDEEVAEQLRRYPKLHVWPRRAIESLFLDPVLIGTVCRSLGQEISDQQVEQWLVEAARPLTDNVLEGLVDAELRHRVPPPNLPKSGGRFERLQAQLDAYAEVNRKRSELVNEVVQELRGTLDARWSDDWPLLVDPKPVLAVLTQRISILKSPAALMSALVARARDDQSVRPRGLEELRERLAETIGSLME
ncbi:hypothetical protein DVG80_00885 [Rhodococcus erythropolis]|nr:hypothetical protein DVG80_00885 [Rhodococcus erythropolis]